MSFINTTPSRIFGSGAPAGPCLSTAYVKAGADALGVAFELTADGVSLNGQRFATLAEGDADLELIAEAMGELLALKDAAQVQENRQTVQRYQAQMALEGVALNALPLALRF